LNVRGHLVGDSLYINKDRGLRITADFDLRDVTNTGAGIVAATVDTVTLAGIALDTIGGVLRLEDWTHSRFDAGVLSRNGPTAAATGIWNRMNGGHDVRLDSLGLTVRNGRWSLSHPTSLAIDSMGGVRLDSLLLRNSDSAFVSLAAALPETGPVLGRL